MRVMYFVQRNGLNLTAYKKNIDKTAMSTADPMARLKLLKIKIPNSESMTSRHVIEAQENNCERGSRKLMIKANIHNSVKSQRLRRLGLIRNDGRVLFACDVQLLFPLWKFSSQIRIKTNRVNIADR